MTNLTLTNPDFELLIAIRTVLTQTRTKLQYAVNHTMVQTYWNVGRLMNSVFFAVRTLNPKNGTELISHCKKDSLN